MGTGSIEKWPNSVLCATNQRIRSRHILRYKGSTLILMAFTALFFSYFPFSPSNFTFSRSDLYFDYYSVKRHLKYLPSYFIFQYSILID